MVVPSCAMKAPATATAVIFQTLGPSRSASPPPPGVEPSLLLSCAAAFISVMASTASYLGSARSGPYCVGEQSSRGDGRLFGEDPAQKHIVRLSVGIGTAIAGYQNPVIEVEGLAEGGEDNTAGMHACEHKGFDGFRLQNSLEIGPAEGADTMLDNNRLTFDRSNSGVDLRSRTGRLEKPALGKERKSRVARADLRIAGAKGDDDVNDQHVGGPRGGE